MIRDPMEWEYLGKCKDCNCPMYLISGIIRQTSDMPGHVCKIFKENLNENEGRRNDQR